MYALRRTAEYEEELRAIEAGAGAVEPRLLQGAYQTFQQDPHIGLYSRTRSVWLLRQNVIPGLLLVQIAYEIDDAAKVVTLLSIRPIDTTRL